MLTETRNDLLADLGLPADTQSSAMDTLLNGNSKYIRDLRINLKNALKADGLSTKEAYLIAVSIASNNQNDLLRKAFETKAKEAGATEAEIAEAVACASLLAANNVFYRFRHFMSKEKYSQIPAKIKMTIMMKPTTGKEFFELMSLAISAVNGCEMCVNAHEDSLIKLGTKEERIFDAVRLASVITSLEKVYY